MNRILYDVDFTLVIVIFLCKQDAFPPKKMTEAIIFCQEEILKYICDNIIVQTAQTLSNPK